jgi:hypothetical protein
VAQERVHEEQTAGQLIARLEAMDFATEAFERAFAEFANSVKTHADAEEHDELPALTKDASPEELGRIYDALQRVPELAGQQVDLSKPAQTSRPCSRVPRLSSHTVQ